MAVNKDPFVRTTRKDGLPSTVRLPVQAGTTKEIKIGEICAFNKTASYVTPIDAEADFMYALVIAKEEQKAADSARYIEFYDLAPEDEFEFILNAARSLAVGDRFVLTASYSQILTYSATKYPVARCVDGGHYPETGTTIRSQSYARVSFNPACTYYGLISNGFAWGTPKQITSTSALTLYYEMSGLTILHTGAATTDVEHILPVAGTAPVGTNFKAINLNAATGSVSFNPGTASGIYVDGAKATDNEGRGIAQTAATGSYLSIQAIGSNDWYAIADSGSGTAQAIA
jgi:hypothetical protein